MNIISAGNRTLGCCRCKASHICRRGLVTWMAAEGRPSGSRQSRSLYKALLLATASAVENCRNLPRDFISCAAQGLVYVDIALSYTARGMAEEGGNGEFRVSEVAGDARKSMA